ncbi:arylacetamide deacetylase-like 2 [Asterias amurensis]|uniref:arylacetamide deacetylase-like 2 n=1 Tax=Asterias amurensis TaxID=7602 RepID=UPI003AB37BBD
MSQVAVTGAPLTLRHMSRFIIIIQLLGSKKTTGKGFCFDIPAIYLLIEKIEVTGEHLEIDVTGEWLGYCLATKRKFPAAHEDSMRALRYFLIHASEFGVDPARIGVAGDSAGGHLAAAVAQEASDDPSLPRLKIQVLLYPLLQLLDLQMPSYQKYVYDFGLTGGVLTEPTLGIMLCVYLLGRIDEDFMTSCRVNNHTSLAFKKDNPTYYNHELVPAGLRKHVSYKIVHLIGVTGFPQLCCC